MNVFIRLLLLTLILNLSSMIYSHHKDMIDKHVPVPPPTIDPGPDAALLIVHIIDSETNETTSATACINEGAQEPDNDPYHKFSLRQSGNRHKGPIQYRPSHPVLGPVLQKNAYSCNNCAVHPIHVP